MLATNLYLVMATRQHTKLTTTMKIVPMRSCNRVPKKISIKGKKGGNQIFQAQFKDYIEIKLQNKNKIFWLER
jgi:hypothetical protein